MSHALADLLRCEDDEDPGSRLRVALDLHDAGVEMMELRLRRDARLTDADVARRLSDWLAGPAPEAGGTRVMSWEEWLRRR